MLERTKRSRKADGETFRGALFGLLHEPPTLSGFNRTTWRMEDLRQTLAGRGFPACPDVIREAMRKEGFRWRSAKVVLTSTDPQYREKLERVQTVLADLGDDERFFSVVRHRARPTPGHEAGAVAGEQWRVVVGWIGALLTRSAFAWCCEPVQ